MITRTEELVINAWPALQTVLYDGWVVRFAGNVTRRAYSVNPIYFSNLPVQQKIDYCEKMYLSQNLEPVFKLTEKVFPEDLDLLLESRGYKSEPAISVQYTDLDALPLAFEDWMRQVRILKDPDSGWVENWLRFSGIDLSLRDTYLTIFGNISTPKCLLTYEVEGKPAACALGVIENGNLGLFDIVVAPEHRGLWYGRYVVEGLLFWGKKNGAKKAYLQVVESNRPAIKLYGKLGFREAYRCWYRVKRVG